MGSGEFEESSALGEEGGVLTKPIVIPDQSYAMGILQLLEFDSRGAIFNFCSSFHPER
jgi:hypothetical protein